MMLDETLIAPRTEGEQDDTVLPKPHAHSNDDGKGRYPTPTESNPQILPHIINDTNDAGVTKKDPQKQKREARTYTQDVPCFHDDADLQMTPPQESPKKSKKLRTDRDTPSSRERTGSKTLPQTKVQT